MGDHPIRVALFADSYLEIDGVANTVRQFEAYARRRGMPFLLLHGGYEEERIERSGNFTRVELPRGSFRFPLDRKHDFDLLFFRHLGKIEQILREFAPDVVHITGPSDVGIIGALVSHRLHVPLLASWHTNVHQYAERRALPLFFFLPQKSRQKIGTWIREICFRLTARFYQIPRILMAPNRELIELLERATGKPCYLMARGVDTELFHPRVRTTNPDRFTIGYVGRLTLEKNVEMLVEIENRLIAAGITDCHFLVVGQGSSEKYLGSNLKNRTLTGVLRGQDLTRAYASMDLFLFPSKTDTFGNVVLEALAAGTPALVTDQGGPQFIVRPGETGFICRGIDEFLQHVERLRRNPDELNTLRTNARRQAEAASWDSVFQAVYRAYEDALNPRIRSAGANLNMPLRSKLES